MLTPTGSGSTSPRSPPHPIRSRHRRQICSQGSTSARGPAATPRGLGPPSSSGRSAASSASPNRRPPEGRPPNSEPLGAPKRPLGGQHGHQCTHHHFGSVG